MKTPRVHPAYSLEIVVSDDQMKRTGQIVANGPGHVDVRVTGPQAPCAASRSGGVSTARRTNSRAIRPERPVSPWWRTRARRRTWRARPRSPDSASRGLAAGWKRSRRQAASCS
jgi:hypothetical protein